VTVDVTHFDPLSESFAEQHWEQLADLRACPIGRSELYGGLWILARYDDVLHAARDWQTYSSAEGSSPVPLETGGSVKLMPISTDPPIQRDLRKLIDRHFGVRLMPAAEQATRAIAVELFERFQSRGECEFMAEFAVKFPAYSFFNYAFGVPPETSTQVMGWLDRLLAAPHDSVEQVQAFFGWTQTLLDTRRAGEPRDDVLNSLLTGTIEGRELTDSERSMVLMNLIIGGVDTTALAIGSIVYHLATDPDLRARLAEDRSLIPAAVEEFLRLDPPNSLRGRAVTCPIEVNGSQLAPKDRMVLAYGAANRDPDKYDSPDELVIDRFAGSAPPHMTFGAGPHRCPGSHFARMEIAVALDLVLDRLVDLDLAVDRIEYTVGLTRGPRELPITFRPVG
jgi:cytochrome P450